jgi:hypothetical protein
MIGRATLMSVLLAFLAVSAGAETMPLWKRVGQWQVRVDTSVGYGCFILAEFEKGSVFRIGWSETDKTAYLMLANTAWASLEVGKEYELRLQFDNAPAWRVPATVMLIGGARTLMSTFNEAEFIMELARKQHLDIHYRNRAVTRLFLTGSYAAVLEMFSCQKVIREAGLGSGGRRDPFASRPAASSDPFAR